MAGIGTRSGVCPGFIATPNNTCKLCGKREYQHTFEGNDVPIEIMKSKTPFIETMDPNEGSIEGGESIVLTGRNFSRIRYNKGLLWAKFGKYKVNLTMDALGKVACISPRVLINIIHKDDLKLAINQHGKTCYALEVRLTADGGITWSNPEYFRLKIDRIASVNKYDASKCYYWGGLKPPEKKKKAEKDKPIPTYDMFLNTTPRVHPHYKYSYTRACYKLLFYLHLATGRCIPKYSYEYVKRHIAEQTASYPYTEAMHINSSGEGKLALFKDIFLSVVGWKDVLDDAETRDPGIEKVVSWIKGGNETTVFRQLLNAALDYLCREEQPVRHIRITKSMASPHAIILMENGMIEIQSYRNPSNYSSELLDNAYFQSDEELNQDEYRYCRPWDIDDDIKQLKRPERAHPKLSGSGSTDDDSEDNIKSKKERVDWYDREANINMDLTMERLMFLLPFLRKPTNESHEYLTLDGNLLAPSGKVPQTSNSYEKKKDECLKVGGWFWSPFVGSLKPKILMEKVACGSQHFCCVTSVMYGHKLYTWGDNGAGQLGRRTSSGDNLKPANIPSVVTFETSNDPREYDEMQVYAVNCGSLYTICACISAVTGKTHVYSFGQPNDQKLPREKRCLPHKVIGLEEPSEILLFNRPQDYETVLKRAKNLEMREWAKGKPMTTMGKCSQFWPNGLDQYHDTIWHEWTFFRRKEVKEFKNGHDHEHMSMPLLSRYQIPQLFGFEKSQHDNLRGLYVDAIEEMNALISMTDGMIHDLNDTNEVDGIIFGDEINAYINVQKIVQNDFRKYDVLAAIDEGGRIQNNSSNNNENSVDKNDDEEIGLVRGERRSMFLDIVLPSKEVLIKSDVGWVELLDEIHLVKAKTKKVKAQIDEAEISQNKQIEITKYIEYALEQIEVVKHEKENPQVEMSPKGTPRTELDSKKSTLAPLRRRLSKLSGNEFLPISGIKTPSHNNDNENGRRKDRNATLALQATQKLLTPTKQTKRFTSKKTLRSSQSFVNSRKTMSMKSRISAFSEEPRAVDDVTSNGNSLSSLRHDLKDGLHLLSYSQLNALNGRLNEEVKLRKVNIMVLNNLADNLRKEFEYLKANLKVHEELQRNWVLCDILDYKDELLSPNAQAARVAYRSGKTAFEKGISNAEDKWKDLCTSMPSDVVRMYINNLSALKDVGGLRRKEPFKDVLRNIDHVYVDENANIGYKDFLDCSDLLLGNVLDTLQDWSNSEMSRLNTGEGLKLLQMVFSSCKLRTQINLTQHRKQARIYELEYGMLERAKTDPSTILVAYQRFGPDGKPVKQTDNEDNDKDGKNVSGKEKMATKKVSSRK